MANKSIYETSFAAGQTGGEYEAGLQGVGDVWSDIESSRAMTAQRGERRGQTLDTILAATELTSQVAGGMQARQEFKSTLKQVGGDIGTAGVKVGKGGEAWGDLNPLEKLFQKPEYQFGEGVQMTRADITTAGEMLQYGGTPDYTRFKPESMAEEVGGFGEFIKRGKEKLSSTLSKRKTEKESGKFYGEKRGFDIGDIYGEKSVFAAGKQKFSSVISSAGEKISSLIPEKKPQVGEGTVLKVDEGLEARQKELEAVPSFSKDYSKARRKLDKLKDEKDKEGKFSYAEAQKKKQDDSILRLIGTIP